MTYIGEGTNEYGTPISIFLCVDCHLPFTTCPASKTEALRWGWSNGGCLRPQCRSYDPARDVDLWGFGDSNGLVEAQLRGQPKALAWKGRKPVEVQREPVEATPEGQEAS